MSSARTIIFIVCIIIRTEKRQQQSKAEVNEKKNNKSQIKAFNVINVKQTNLQSLIQYLFEKEKEKQQQETNKASTVSMLNRIRFGTIFFSASES